MLSSGDCLTWCIFMVLGHIEYGCIVPMLICSWLMECMYSISKNYAHSCYFVGYCYWSGLPISFRVASLALGQSYDFCWVVVTWLNMLRLRQHGHHFADNTFKCIFLNGNVSVYINISLNFVSKALVQIMSWRRLAIIWTSDGCIYASLSLIGLKIRHQNSSPDKCL